MPGAATGCSSTAALEALGSGVTKVPARTERRPGAIACGSGRGPAHDDRGGKHHVAESPATQPGGVRRAPAWNGFAHDAAQLGAAFDRSAYFCAVLALLESSLRICADVFRLPSTAYVCTTP